MFVDLTIDCKNRLERDFFQESAYFVVNFTFCEKCLCLLVHYFMVEAIFDNHKRSVLRVL